VTWPGSGSPGLQSPRKLKPEIQPRLGQAARVRSVPEAEPRRKQDFYRSKAGLYGLPPDVRSTVTKPEWMLWAACLAADRPLLEDWSERIVRYANETPSRVPFSDLYFVESGRKMGFQARSVVGGVLVAILAERWKA
jgi:hypothetical protein